MKLMQLNVWMGRLTPQIVNLIQAVKPDMIVSQEVFSTEADIVFPDRTMNVLQEMQKAGNLQHSYFSPVHTFDIEDAPVGLGNAILSAFPIVEAETIFTNGELEEHINHSSASHTKNTRNAQFVKLQVGVKTLYVVNHHGHWEPTPEGSPISLERMQVVANKLQQLKGPTIFAGDLNVNPHTQAMQVFDGILEDLTATNEVATTLSVLGKVPNVACDHILVSPDVIVEGFEVSEELVSDHKALILEFDI